MHNLIFESFETNYADDVVSDVLKAQLEIFNVSMNGCDITCFNDILDKMKELQEPQKSTINEVVMIFKLLQVLLRPYLVNADVFPADVCRKYGCVRRLLQPAAQQEKGPFQWLES